MCMYSSILCVLCVLAEIYFPRLHMWRGGKKFLFPGN